MGDIRWVGVFAVGVLAAAASCNGHLDDGGAGGEADAGDTDASVATDTSVPATDSSAIVDASADIAVKDARADTGADAADDGGDDAGGVDAGSDGSSVADAGVCLDLTKIEDRVFCKSHGCLGGCDVSLGETDPRSTCRLDCAPVCPPEPVFTGVCPVECNAGCAGGVCNIDTVLPNTGATTIVPLPSLTVPGQPDPGGATYSRTVCPEGLPCKVIRGGSKIFCPRTGSCEIDDAGPDTHVFCGSGPCTVRGGEWLHGIFPLWEYNYAADVCGDSCDCTIPYPTAVNSLTSPTSMGTDFHRCVCNDGTFGPATGMPCNRLDRSGCPAATRCPVACAAHGGWADP